MAHQSPGGNGNSAGTGLPAGEEKRKPALFTAAGGGDADSFFLKPDRFGFQCQPNRVRQSSQSEKTVGQRLFTAHVLPPR